MQFEFREIVGTIEMEMAAKKTRWRELVKGRGNLWRAGIMIVSLSSPWALVRGARSVRYSVGTTY